MSEDQEGNQDGVDGINMVVVKGSFLGQVSATIGGARQLEPEPHPCLRSPMLHAELPPAWLLGVSSVSRFGHRN